MPSGPEKFPMHYQRVGKQRPRRGKAEVGKEWPRWARNYMVGETMRDERGPPVAASRGREVPSVFLPCPIYDILFRDPREVAATGKGRRDRTHLQSAKGVQDKEESGRYNQECGRGQGPRRQYQRECGLCNHLPDGRWSGMSAKNRPYLRTQISGSHSWRRLTENLKIFRAIVAQRGRSAPLSEPVLSKRLKAGSRPSRRP